MFPSNTTHFHIWLLEKKLDLSCAIVCDTGLALPSIGSACLVVIAKTLYNKTVNSPQNVKSLSVLSPGIGSWN